jgi:hypothetical protein
VILPASLPDGSGCWIRIIRMSVSRRQASHLLLIRTNLGYGTVLTAACARQGCDTTDYYYYYVRQTGNCLSFSNNGSACTEYTIKSRTVEVSNRHINSSHSKLLMAERHCCEVQHCSFKGKEKRNSQIFFRDTRMVTTHDGASVTTAYKSCDLIPRFVQSFAVTALSETMRGHTSASTKTLSFKIML